MPTVRQMFPPNYIKAEDLRGKDVTLTIADIVREGVPKPPAYKKPGDPEWIISFVEIIERHKKNPKRYPKAPRLICNKTNALAIASHHGSEATGWIGKKITLYEGRARNPNTGKMGPAIRVRAKDEVGGEAGELPAEPADIDPERLPDDDQGGDEISVAEPAPDELEEHDIDTAAAKDED